MSRSISNSNKPLSVGLIGLGNMGQNHLRVLSSLASIDVKWVYDIDEEKSKKLAQAYETHSINDLDTGLASVEAAIICTPSVCHYDDLNRVSKYVDRVFIEKPLTSDLESSRKALELIHSKKLKVQVGFIERFNPVVRELQKILTSSGRTINIDFTRTNRLSSRIKDVDVVTDLMIHDLDLALHFNGPIRSVSSYGVKEEGTDGRKLISFASAVLTHENGAFSRIIASRITDKKIRRIEATCDDKYIDCELIRKDLLIYKQSKIESRPEHYSISGTTETVEVRQEEALMSELQSFARYARGSISEESVPTAQDGLNAIELATQIIKGI